MGMSESRLHRQTAAPAYLGTKAGLERAQEDLVYVSPWLAGRELLQCQQSEASWLLLESVNELCNVFN